MSKVIYYIGDMGERDTALAVHTRNIAALLNRLGFEVKFLCCSINPGRNRYDTKDEYEYTYTKDYTNIPKLRGIEMWSENIWAQNLFCKFKELNDKDPAFAVIFYGYSGEKQILRYCKKNNIAFYLDRTDWFEWSDRKHNLQNWINQKLADRSIEHLDLQSDGVISISKFFYDYYTQNNVKTFWMPPLFNLPRINLESITVSSPIRLIYAGSLGSEKDTIDPVIHCLINFFNSESLQFTLDLVGVSEEDLNSRFGACRWSDYGIFAHGKLSHAETVAKVAASDFGILLRQNKRYAKAGFSTKFAESMSNGVPMICTKIGGTDLLVDDGKNGLLIEDNSSESLQKVLDRILYLSPDEIIQMKKNALMTAQENFEGTLYKDKIQWLLALQ